MDRRTLAAAALTTVILAVAGTPGARADRLGGDFRGPDDVYVLREDPPPAGDKPTPEDKPAGESAPSTSATTRPPPRAFHPSSLLSTASPRRQ